MAATLAAEFVERVRALRRSARRERDFLTTAADMDEVRPGRLNDYRRASKYYGGEHGTRLTAREKEYLEASGLTYCENYCETIVDAAAGSQTMRGFSSTSTELAQFARDLQRENRFDALQKRVHRGTVKLGDYFLILEHPGEGKGLPRAHANHPKQVKVVYDSDEALYAVKVWNTSRKSVSNPDGRPIKRMNVYWPDAIEKWYCRDADGDVWAPFHQVDGEEGNTAFWTMDGTPDGEPIGIPVIHFARKPDEFYGRSKLQGVIPQQDALNKTLIDLYWVMDAQGWPWQYATGAEANDVVRHPGSFLTVKNPDAKIGQLDPADPSKAIGAAESQIKRMSATSSTPLHLMLAGGNLPSGETLKTSESGFVREGEDFQTDNGNRWEDFVYLARRIERAYGDREVPDDAWVEAQWKSVETRNQVDEWNVAILKDTLGVSRSTILSEQGYDPDDERRKRKKDIGPDAAADELLRRAREMQGQPTGTIQAPTRSEELGGGEQPAQDPANRRTRT